MKVGDVFRVKLPETDVYLFGRVMLYVPDEKEEDPFNVCHNNYFRFHRGCYLLNVYEQISTSDALENRNVILPGVFAHASYGFPQEGVEIIDHFPVQPQELDFPELLSQVGGGTFMIKGDLKLKFLEIGKHIRVKKEPEAQRFHIYEVADRIFNLIDKKDLITREYPQTFDFHFFGYAPHAKTSQDGLWLFR